jgi:SAM-dependent methyltransferase
MNQTIPLAQHDSEIHENLAYWDAKPLLQRIYHDFHKKIAHAALPESAGITVELGSGIGNIKEVIPHCLRTDLFPNPWLDQVENAYSLSFKNDSVANVILFDVFHHLQYPGKAFEEFYRVLIPGGRVLIFDPCLSLLGLLVYGLAHHEPIGIWRKISWRAPDNWTPIDDSYYAAQGNAYRIFWGTQVQQNLPKWKVLSRARFSAISYVCSGGYSKPQLYPDSAYGIMRGIDTLLDYLPQIFATRLLVVLEKVDGSTVVP